MQKTIPRPAPTTTEPTGSQPSARHGVDLADDILDEIDAVLEETTVAHRYIQRGGQ